MPNHTLSLICLVISDTCAPLTDEFVIQVHPTASISSLTQKILDTGHLPLGYPDDILLWKTADPIVDDEHLSGFVLDRENWEELSVYPRAQILQPMKAIGHYFQRSLVEPELLIQRATPVQGVWNFS
ncbi:hypothetical protein CPB84DRAFT_1960702 [Gymnopilus junonius]|uniref:Ubiquitin-like domain-containing protein n=1 Tax=Gymnopilus junonius TaxID=109634 RepID=A0A9P5NUV3_GYMJU|nr:hypothetical protein CPB84DRAFT_1960702 [Gymnopilus junonius]